MDGTAAAVSQIVGGHRLHTAFEFETGDTLYVDEDAFAKGHDAILGLDDEGRAYAFDIGAHQSFLGKGVILGPEDGRGRHTGAVMLTSRLAGIVFMAPTLSDREGMAPK